MEHTLNATLTLFVLASLAIVALSVLVAVLEGALESTVHENVWDILSSHHTVRYGACGRHTMPVYVSEGRHWYDCERMDLETDFDLLCLDFEDEFLPALTDLGAY